MGKQIGEHTNQSTSTQTDSNPISEHEMLAARKAMANLVIAGNAISNCSEWLDELSFNDWNTFGCGADKAATGICSQLAECYNILCSAYNIPTEGVETLE